MKTKCKSRLPYDLDFIHDVEEYSHHIELFVMVHFRDTSDFYIEIIKGSEYIQDEVRAISAPIFEAIEEQAIERINTYLNEAA